MATIPSIKRFRSEDYPDLDSKFLENLNLVIEPLVVAISGNLNTVNLANEIYERYAIPKNTDVSPSRPLKLAWAKSLPPAAVVAAGIWAKGNDANQALGLNVSLEWNYDTTNKKLLIKKINGLTLPSVSVEYQITILCFCK